MKKNTSKQNTSFFPSSLSFTITFILICSLAFAQTTEEESLPSDTLKKLSLEELLNVEIEVTSVSKRPERLSESASAVQVITWEDIRNSGATTIPEALRLATNLQVAQANSSEWAISARGFNNTLSNKLLVLIDGRVVYTPLYAGVFWDVQNLVLDNIERIEVISGPGGTLWGGNAVNGVINITTKSSKETQGLFVEAAAGTELLSQGTVRYGGKLADNLSYRVYGTAFKRGDTFLNENLSPHDSWTMAQGGLRLDYEPTEKDKVMVISHIYHGRPDPRGNKPYITNGGNMLGRWSHSVSEKSDFRLQAYYDQTFRNHRDGFTDNLKTYDLDWQHRIEFAKRHELVWGSGVRLMDDKVTNPEMVGFLPTQKTLHLLSAFLQDEITLIPDRLRFTIGSKFEHNNYSGFQYQPSGRLSWIPANLKHQTIWAAVSRAVRNPSRIDRDFFAYNALLPGVLFVSPNTTFKSEELIAYELGWRIQPKQQLSISVSSFFNSYDNLRSAEPGPPPLGVPIIFANGLRGESYGLELSATHQVLKNWSLRGGYTFIKKNIWLKSNSADINKGLAEGNEPENQFLIQSNIKFPKGIEFGTVVRYIDKLSKTTIPDYLGLDLRLGWKVSKVIELNVVGQNLANQHHVEFFAATPRRIERSVYGKITCRF